ncbi:hypothetical protein COU74_02645 [Candidatus Peregrinibacteria bacterium CG10_big_fil_rev_8_21_14_0_10_36_19]|nr:MAG: hypothetical protein COU74_02645 [Candidatus Peregrinibacteria bacterium CG10_big_fil_rev_8_21_14_0_10_36_19]
MSFLKYREIAGKFKGGETDAQNEHEQAERPEINVEALENDLKKLLGDAISMNRYVIHESERLEASNLKVIYSFNPFSKAAEITVKNGHDSVAGSVFQYDNIVGSWKLTNVKIYEKFKNMGIGTAIVRVFEHYAKQVSPEITEVSMSVRRLTVLVLAANEGYVPDEYNARVFERDFDPKVISLDESSHMNRPQQGRLSLTLFKKLEMGPEIAAERNDFKARILEKAGV